MSMPENDSHLDTKPLPVRVWFCHDCDAYWADHTMGPTTVVSCEPTHRRMYSIEMTPATKLVRAESERDRYKAAFERIVEIHEKHGGNDDVDWTVEYANIAYAALNGSEDG